MKKTLPIILLSVFTFAFSAFGFLGIQPVKASTTVGTVTVEDTDVNYEGASLTYAEQDTTGSVTTSGNGKMKFYSSLTKTLYESLTQATDVEFKTGTLIIPAELLTGEDIASRYESLTVRTQNAKNVDTTNCWVLYDKDEDGVDENNDYWAMASLYSIPRAYYGVPMAARPYLAIKVAGDADYTYFYASADGITDFYSFAGTAQAKVKAGDYDDKEELKTAITNDYTKFKVTFHFAELHELNQGLVNEFNGATWQESRTFTIEYGQPLPSAATLYSGTYFMNYDDSQYRQRKGFYNESRTVLAVQEGNSMGAGDLSSAVGGTAGASFDYYSKINDTFLTRVYGDMNLYEEFAPANLIDDFSTADSVFAAYGKSVASNGKYTYGKRFEHENASWVETKTAVDYKTGETVTETGVLAVGSQFVTSEIKENGVGTGTYAPSTGTHYFHFTSSIRDNSFWRNSYTSGGSNKVVDITAEDFYTNSAKQSDYDYINFRVLVESNVSGVETVSLSGLYGLGNYANQNPTKVPVNQWVNIKIERAQCERIATNYGWAAYRDNNTSANTILQITPANVAAQKVEGAFKLYVDYMAYERDMRIAINGKDGYRTIDNTHAHSDVNVKSVRYDNVTSIIGEEVKLSTALTNGTIVYTVTDPDGQTVTLTGENLDTFTPTKLGVYSVKATCDDYVLQANSRPNYKFVAKQYGEKTFEVVNRQVTATLKNANGDAINLEEADILGDDAYIDFIVEGVDTLLPESTSYLVHYVEQDQDVIVVDNRFTINGAGRYTIIVKYTDVNGYEHSSQEITLYVKGAEITASMTETATIGVTESLDITATADAQYTLAYSTKLPTGTILELKDNVLPIGLVGDYEVYVTAYKGELVAGVSVLPLTVKAMTTTDVANSGVYATFGYEGTQVGAWKVTETDKSSNKGKNTVDSIAGGTLADGTPWTADWQESLTDKNGVTKYGVISTRPQIINAGSNVANGIYLRSDVYSASDIAKPFYGSLSQSGKAYIYNAIINNEYDYLSIPIYIENADAEEGETHTVYTIYNTSVFKVPYNTWYELQITKDVLAGNMSSYRPNALFSYRSAAGTSPLFYMSSAADSAEKLAKDKDLKVYIDGIRTAKLDDEEFTTIKFVYTDSTGAENGADVGYEPIMATTAYTNTNKTYAACSYFMKPVIYIGDKLVPNEDLVFDRTGSYQLTYNSSGASSFATTKVLEVQSLGVSNGTPRTNTTFKTRVTYTNPDDGKVYRGYLFITPTFTVPPQA